MEVSLRTGVRIRNFDTSKRKQVMADFGKYKRAAAGDIAYNMMRMWQGAVGVAPVDGLVSPAYVVARPFPNTKPSYYASLFRMGLYMGEIDAVSRGIVKDRNRLYWDQFKQMRSLFPPPDEQLAIVRFLDHANRKIDGFIRAKRKLIGLLNEQKQAIIYSAVTRGLDPNTKLKPSGVSWLDNIPEHWEVRRLSIVAQFDSGKAHEQFVDAAGTHIYVSARFVSTGGVTRKFCTRNFSPAKKGDVLMVMSDLPNGRALARAYLVEDDASYAVNQRVCIIRPKKMVPEFLAYQANRNWGLLQNDDHCNQTHLSNRDYKTLPLLCPPLPEQEEIVRMVHEATKHIPITITRTEREIALMQEYRTRLTADIVTGKLDVREAAAKLPEEKLEEVIEADISEDETELEEVEN
ncbi:MAG: restriction endonuclease subunit S [Luteolibacter sp.]